MEWLGCSDEMQPSEWRWKAEGGKLIPVMTDKSYAPDALTQTIHCNCLEGCNTLRCTYRKHGLECTSARRHCRLTTPFIRRSTVGKRSFPVFGDDLWNELPADITSAPSLPVFRQRLKTFLLRRSYPGVVV